MTEALIAKLDPQRGYGDRTYDEVVEEVQAGKLRLEEGARLPVIKDASTGVTIRGTGQPVRESEPRQWSRRQFELRAAEDFDAVYDAVIASAISGDARAQKLFMGASVMCPSYRITGDEQHLTRGRANSLRLAISGQLGEGALVSDDMYETMSLCVSCKACKRECPTGVDMAKMKIEFLHHYHQRHRLSLKDRLIAYLPHYAQWASKLSFLMNLRDQIPGLAWGSELLLGFSHQRHLPYWRRDRFQPTREAEHAATSAQEAKEVVLLVDTFTTHFEPENARAALQVL